MVHQFDKVDLNVYLRERYYLVYYSRNTKMFQLMKVSHILQLSQNRTAEDYLLTAKSPRD